MQKLINDTLRQIEQEHNIRILHAIESGSRAWGFASTDSDYDIRFIYVRPLEHYLKLDAVRDVIELPINTTLDINGWDLKKALQLLHRSNPTLFEWMSTPIIYRQTDFAERLRSLLQQYFSPGKATRHYLHMAERNYRAYLTSNMVRAKKYFYVLRPILACRWILEHHTPPPMPFTELAASQLEESMKSIIENLLELKMNSPEVREIPQIVTLNQYLDTSIADIKNTVQHMKTDTQADWEPLDHLFRAIVLGNS